MERGEETKKKASSLSSSSSPWGTTSGYIPCRPLPLSRVPDLRGEGGKGKEPTFLSLSPSPPRGVRPSVRCPNQGERSPSSPSPQPANNAVECERKAARGVESTSTEGLSLSRMPLPPPLSSPHNLPCPLCERKEGEDLLCSCPFFPFPQHYSILRVSSEEARAIAYNREGEEKEGEERRRRRRRVSSRKRGKIGKPSQGWKKKGGAAIHPPHIACYACLPVQYVVFMLPPSSNVMRRWRRASILA